MRVTHNAPVCADAFYRLDLASWCLADRVGGDAHLCADGWLLRASDPSLDLMAQVRIHVPSLPRARSAIGDRCCVNRTRHSQRQPILQGPPTCVLRMVAGSSASANKSASMQVSFVHLLRLWAAAAHRVQRAHHLQVCLHPIVHPVVILFTQIPLFRGEGSKNPYQQACPWITCTSAVGADLTTAVLLRSCTSAGNSGSCTQLEPSNPSTNAMCQAVDAKSALRLSQVWSCDRPFRDSDRCHRQLCAARSTYRLHPSACFCPA